MRTGKLRNKLTKEIISVSATTDHPDSQNGKAVWINSCGKVLMDVDSQMDDPQYEVVFDSNEERLRIGRLVASLREDNWMTVRQLAENAGITASNLSRIEHGKYNVSIEILARICECIGARIEIVKANKKDCL